jgi:hypothetical protein
VLIPALALALLVGAGPAAPARAASAEDLDPLLRALSIRPWWGDPPAVSVATLDGQRRSLEALKGHAVLLYFWATW